MGAFLGGCYSYHVSAAPLAISLHFLTVFFFGTAAGAAFGDFFGATFGEAFGDALGDALGDAFGAAFLAVGFFGASSFFASFFIFLAEPGGSTWAFLFGLLGPSCFSSLAACWAAFFLLSLGSAGRTSRSS